MMACCPGADGDGALWSRYQADALEDECSDDDPQMKPCL